jgi:predicted CoA-binding protein
VLVGRGGAVGYCVAMHIIDSQSLKRILQESHTIAVLGASMTAHRPAFYVPDYLHEHGYRVLPVNPRYAGETQWGEPFRSTLAELGEPIDLVDVFRRSELLMPHLDDLVACRPKVVWLQQGIQSDELAVALDKEGIDIVMDECTYARHRQFGL